MGARRFERFIREDEDVEYFTGESAGADADAFIAEVDALRTKWNAIPWTLLQRMFMVTLPTNINVVQAEFDRGLQWLRDNKPEDD